LLVTRTNGGAFVVTKQREVDGSWPVPLVEFRGTSDIDQGTTEFPQLVDGTGMVVAHA